MSLDPEVRDALSQLLADLGMESPVRISTLRGGRNNRVFRVNAGTRPLLLKQYYSDALEPRDRLSAELAFSRFAWEHGVRTIPEPLAAYPLYGIALYEFVDGQRLQPSDVTRARVWEALAFVLAINEHRVAADASLLPFAAEACFGLADHLGVVGARVRRLQKVAAHATAAAPLVAQLTAVWARIRERAEAEDTWSVPHAHRCLSPSDFGFHNAIVRADGRLIFHDFEYAGWDDPVKLICDFFSQVEVPVSLQWIDAFAAELFGGLGLLQSHRHRLAVLLPVYRVKWCCIVLNEFLPDAGRRRRFADPRSDAEERQRAQLRRAAELISRIERECDGLR